MATNLRIAKRSSAIVFGSVLAVLLLCSSAMAAADDTNGADDISDSSIEGPKGDWDFSIYNYSGSDYDKWAAGPGYDAYFGAGEAGFQVTRLEAADGAWASMEARALAPPATQVEPPNEFASVDEDAHSIFEDLVADGTSLEYTVALGGLKEELTIDEKPELEADLLFSSVVRYDDDELDATANEQTLSGYSTVGEDIVLKDSQGRTRFAIPRAFVKDSSDVRPSTADPADTEASSLFEWLDYSVYAQPGELWLAVVVPWNILNRTENVWPLIVDPTLVVLDGYSEGNHAYSECVIYMDSSLTIAPWAHLTLNNCQLFFNGNFDLTVSMNGELTLLNSEVDANDTAFRYGFIVNGKLSAINTLVSHTENGIEVYSPQRVVIDNSTIRQSDGDGLHVDVAVPDLVFENNSVFDNDGDGAALIGVHADVDVRSNEFAGNDRGMSFASSGILHGLEGNHAANNSHAGIIATESDLVLEKSSAQNNSEGFVVEGGTVLIDAGSAVLNDVGVRCVNSNLTLLNADITDSATLDIDAEGCALTYTDGNWYEWSEYLEGTITDVRHRVSVLVLDVEGAAQSSVSVTMVDALDDNDAVGTTDADGRIEALYPREFRREVDGSLVFFTPHAVQIGSPYDLVHYYVGGPATLTLFVGGDADNDTIPNEIEDAPSDILWIEAEHKSVEPSQAFEDEDAFGGNATSRGPDGKYFRTGDWPELQPGTYEILVRVAGNGLGASAFIGASVCGGNTLVDAEEHALGPQLEWVETAPFVLESTGRVCPQVTAALNNDSVLVANQAVLVDKLAIARLKDSEGEPTGVWPGAISDALSNDTDRDTLSDGYERSALRAWLEAESTGGPATYFVDDQAVGGRAIEHSPGAEEIVDGQYTLMDFVEGQTYQVWVRARAEGGSGTVEIAAALGEEEENASISVDGAYRWYPGPTVVAPSDENVIGLTVSDASDNNLSDGNGSIRLDAIGVFDLATYPSAMGIFNASRPTAGDTDLDGLNDGTEVSGFFTADEIQAEDYVEQWGITRSLTGVVFNSAGDAATYDIEVRYDGEYRVLALPEFKIGEGGPSEPPWATLTDLLQVQVVDGEEETVDPIAAESLAYRYTDLPTYTGDSYRQIGSFLDARFELEAGSYEVTLFIDPTKASELEGLWLGFRVAIGSFLLQRHGLNTTESDWERDGVLDGRELSNSIFPLNTDSDYDTMADLEELVPGADTYVTLPNRNDTDEDGVFDDIEVGSSRDADPETHTDPTNPDTDGDGLPDGWRDGWMYRNDTRRYSFQPTFKDGLRQPWEGEDLNGDGAVAGDGFGISAGPSFYATGGETNPNLWDTEGDGMDDGWELIVWGRNSTYAAILNPLIDDSAGDNDTWWGWHASGADGLNNTQEYNAGTSPFFADHDLDFIQDGPEAKVAFRTSIPNGTVETAGYWFWGESDWVFLDPTPFLTGDEQTYALSNASWNLSADSGLAPNRTDRIALLSDGGLILYDAANDTVVIWDYDSDPYDADEDGILEGRAWEFTPATREGAVTVTYPFKGYHGREALGKLNPWVRDSDGDGVIDGYDGIGCGETGGSWWYDGDGDGLVSAIDPDADGDGLPDGIEDADHDGCFEPEANETAAYAGDTDDDGRLDSNDSLPLDLDNDYLTGYLEHEGPHWEIDEFAGLEHPQTKDSENWTAYDDADSDGDGILDGIEDANIDGALGANETNPMDSDSDDDGLLDGPTHYVENASINVDLWNMGLSDSVDEVEVGGVHALRFGEGEWYTETVWASTGEYWLEPGVYLVFANLSDTGATTTTPRTFSVQSYLPPWDVSWATTMVLSNVGPNWSCIMLGHIVAGQYGAFDVKFTADRGGFYLGALVLVRVVLGEGYMGTDPLNPDTDNDTLWDGAELNLDNYTIPVGGWNGTDVNVFRPNDNAYWSNPLMVDTDGDGLHDGNYTGLWEGEERAMGEADYGTNPASRDTDGDKLGDFTEALDIGSDGTSPDSDGDMLPDSYEPLMLEDIDYDNKTNILDNDSNADNTLDGNVSIASVVFRTNVTRVEYWRPRTWIAIDLLEPGALTAFMFDQNVSEIPSNAWFVNFSTTMAPPGAVKNPEGWYKWPVKSFEGYAVYYNGTHAFLAGTPGYIPRYRAWTGADGDLPLISKMVTTWEEYPWANFTYRETINWTLVLIDDTDGDGLKNWLEPAYGCDPQDPDTDKDGLPDGFEVYNTSTDPNASDTDGDGLGDGYEFIALHTNPARTDSDNDGLWDGNFTHLSDACESYGNCTELGYEVRAAGELSLQTDPWGWDTDGDFMPDGWEVYYGLNPKNAADRDQDPDFDEMSNCWEYAAVGYRFGPDSFVYCTDDNYVGTAHYHVPHSFSYVWWDGNDPRQLDSDNDSMPDGWEWVYGINPRSNDASADPDSDFLSNAEEYALSIVGEWDTSRSWPIDNATDPLNNDTDGDGESDWEENANFPEWATRDDDADGLSNAVDDDSDDDGLGDWIEYAGWDVGFVEAELVRQMAASPEMTLDDGQFVWSHQASDPFDPDSDDDGLGDLGEFMNLSNPVDQDTDNDKVNDAVDYAFNSTTNLSDTIALSTFQDILGPTIALSSWTGTIEFCGSGPINACVNITFRVLDPQGIRDLKFQHLGTHRVQPWTMYPTTYVVQGNTLVNETSGWMLIPLLGNADMKGGFQVSVTAADGLGNSATEIFEGGDTLSRSIALASSLRSVGHGDLRTMTGSRHYDLRGSSVEDVAGWVGGQYGFELAAVHGFAFADDIWWRGTYGVEKSSVWVFPPPTDAEKAAALKEKMDWVLTHDPTCNPTKDWYFDARWEYSNAIARMVNPFEPELEDEINMTTALGVFDMFCRVYRHEDNLSNFTKWFVAFFDASVKGGAVYEGIMFAASMLPFPSPAMVAKLGASLAKLGRAAIGAMKAIWRGAKFAGGVVKSTLSTMASRIADLAVSTWYNAEIALHDLAVWLKSGLAKFARAIKNMGADPAALNKMRLPLGCAGVAIAVCLIARHPNELSSWSLLQFAGGLIGAAKGSWRSLVGKVIKVGEEEFEMGYHAAQQMARHRIPTADVEHALATNSFPYRHEGITKRGFYDHETQTFVGTLQSGKLTTVMQGPGVQQYLVSMRWL
jgi:hypothetical protein